MGKFIDLTGDVFGRLAVVSRCADNDRWNKPLWICSCECGNQTIVNGGSLRDGKTNSCGCLSAEVAREMAIKRFTKHGEATRDKSKKWENMSTEYKAWLSMKQRIKHPNKKCYEDISICESWANSYECFLSNMGLAPSPNHQVDRIDNSKGYFPGNCRWATRSQNCNNKTDNFKIEWQGEVKNLYEWAAVICPELGIKPDALQARFASGWSVEKAFQTPRQTNDTAIEWRGQTKTVRQWHKEIYRSIGISENTLRYRLSSGWSVEDAFTTGKTANQYTRKQNV